MCYLHEIHILHQDLRLKNILLNITKEETMNETTKYVVLKLIDFEVSKVDIRSNPKATKNDYF
uniref:Protein kinase domain-containing protein n=1 Tax=Physcomitrium patens TaxID=3218 RepID=A0A2K1K4H2_PHYPA|nr:hypothetical protein PHYPA_013154 [Physcomitrium patens]